MKRLGIAALPVLSVVFGAPNAWAQWSGQIYAGYNASLPTLSSGQSLPLQIDSSGNLKVDCIVGCSTSATTFTAAQGTAASAAGAWPVYLTEGGTAVGSSNPLIVQDTTDGAAITAATMPTGGSGMLGWLSDITKQLSGTITTTDTADGASSTSGATNQGTGLLGWLGTIATELAGTVAVKSVGITGAPTVNAGSLSAAGSVLAAASSGVTRLHMKIWNFSSAGGANLYCTDDGSTPTATNASFIVYAQGGYERDAPGWVPSTAISCLPANGSVSYRAESYP